MIFVFLCCCFFLDFVGTHRILVHVPKYDGRVFSEVGETPQAAQNTHTPLGDTKTDQQTFPNHANIIQ